MLRGFTSSCHFFLHYGMRSLLAADAGSRRPTVLIAKSRIKKVTRSRAGQKRSAGISNIARGLAGMAACAHARLLEAHVSKTRTGSGPTVLRMILARQLQELREKAGLSHEQAAEAIYASPTGAGRRPPELTAQRHSGTQTAALWITTATSRRGHLRCPPTSAT